MASDELDAFELKHEEVTDTMQDCRPYQGPMAVITRGGNELMNSYNTVTQNLLMEVNNLEERLQEQNCELLEVRRENERLLARVHELLLGAELREEAMETKSWNNISGLETEVIHLEIPGNIYRNRYSHNKRETSWLKLAMLLGLTISVSVAIRNGFDV